MKAQGRVHKYGDNVDTDVIIPARYLNTADHKELAAHCMEDIDKEFVKKVQPGDIMVGGVKFRLRLFARARAHRHQGGGDQLRDRQDLCQDLLPQRHQHRAADFGMPGRVRRTLRRATRYPLILTAA